MIPSILIFGGTSEGRQLAELLGRNQIPCMVCVATEYGEHVIDSSDYIHVLCGRMDLSQITSYLTDNKPSHVIDATHPYATEISQNITSACLQTATSCIRLLRDSSLDSGDHILTVSDMEAAAHYLNQTTGKILLTTGSKELPLFCKNLTDTSRVIARVLPSPEVLHLCTGSGLEGRQLICMQGPFTMATNLAMIEQVGAEYLVTKEGGRAGGFPEKIAAARKAGITVLLIKRPVQEKGYSLEEVLQLLNLSSELATPDITLIGAGMGNSATLTLEARDILDNSQLVIGAKRLLHSLPLSQHNVFASYDPEEIHTYIRQHPQYQNIAIVLSGDVGFYSGATKLLPELSEYNVTLLPGISSLACFAAKLKTEWQDMKLISLHGRMQNAISAIRQNRKTFLLVNGDQGLRSLANDCSLYQLNQITLYVGSNLGDASEEICSGKPEDFIHYEKHGLLVILAVNEAAKHCVITHGIPDSAFVRSNVPMTKEEIREISISKLRLTSHSIVYDIGAGTGSVSVECALQASCGTVYAMEKNSEALKLLQENKKLLGASNLEIIEGTAPESFLELEAPTHVFIGGSSGNLRSIVTQVLHKNPQARIVITAISLETLTETSQMIHEVDFTETEIISVSISKAKTLKKYHMMMGNNPVWIISLQNPERS